MAIIKSITKNVFGENLIFPNAYHQVTSVQGNKELVCSNITVFKDQSKEITLDMKVINFVPNDNENATRWDKQTYEYMKTLPEFDGAIDV